MKIAKLLLAVAIVVGCNVQADERCGCNTKPNNNKPAANPPRPAAEANMPKNVSQKK